MAKWGACLLQKYKDLSLDSKNPRKISQVWWCVPVIPSAGAGGWKKLISATQQPANLANQ